MSTEWLIFTVVAGVVGIVLLAVLWRGQKK